MFVYQAAIRAIRMVLLINLMLGNICLKGIKRFRMPTGLAINQPALVPAGNEESPILDHVCIR